MRQRIYERVRTGASLSSIAIVAVIVCGLDRSFGAVKRVPYPEVKVENSDVVFVGYGVVAPDYGWDDYKDIDLRGKVVLLKGTAYVAAGLKAGEGRSIGDLDILVARDDLPQVEAALLAAGWEWVKPDPYDDAYYRDHMHELPPLIHKLRDRMIDVHHTILPRTAALRDAVLNGAESALALPLEAF